MKKALVAIGLTSVLALAACSSEEAPADNDVEQEVEAEENTKTTEVSNNEEKTEAKETTTSDADSEMTDEEKAYKAELDKTTTVNGVEVTK